MVSKTGQFTLFDIKQITAGVNKLHRTMMETFKQINFCSDWPDLIN